MLEQSVQQFLAATAAKTPTPGGGSVAALAGALGASLAAMAIEYTVGKKAAIPHDEKLRSALGQFQQASAVFQELITEDIEAYAALSPLLKLSPEERAKNGDFLATLLAAIRAPQSVLGTAVRVLELCTELLEITNKHLVTDLGIAATLAHATAHASQLNILINLPLLPDGGESATIRKETAELVGKADGVYRDFRVKLLGRL